MVGGWCLLLAHLGYRYVLAPTHILTDLRESLETPTSDKLRSVLARNLTKIRITNWSRNSANGSPHRVR